MGKGGSDGCTDAARSARELPARAAEPVVRADFTNAEHVRSFLECYEDYVVAIDNDDIAGVTEANAKKRVFNRCSEAPVNRAREDNFPFMVNEFAYQLSDRFLDFVRDYCRELEACEPGAKRAKTEQESSQGDPEFLTQVPRASPVSSDEV